MKIKYIVPELYKRGGIQEFAKSACSELKNRFDIEVLNWENDLTLPILTNADLIHFWHPEPAMAFLDKKYIVTCHGMEILQGNIESFRKIMYPKILDKALLVHVNSNYTRSLVMEL